MLVVRGGGRHGLGEDLAAGGPGGQQHQDLGVVRSRACGVLLVGRGGVAVGRPGGEVNDARPEEAGGRLGGGGVEGRPSIRAQWDSS